MMNNQFTNTVILDFHGTATDHLGRLREALKLGWKAGVGEDVTMPYWLVESTFLRTSDIELKPHLLSLREQLLEENPTINYDLFLETVMRGRDSLYIPVDNLAKTLHLIERRGQNVMFFTNALRNDDDPNDSGDNRVWNVLHRQWGLRTLTGEYYPVVGPDNLAAAEDWALTQYYGRKKVGVPYKRGRQNALFRVKPDRKLEQRIGLISQLLFQKVYHPDRTVIVGDHDNDIDQGHVSNWRSLVIIKSPRQMWEFNRITFDEAWTGNSPFPIGRIEELPILLSLDLNRAGIKPFPQQNGWITTYEGNPLYSVRLIPGSDNTELRPISGFSLEMLAELGVRLTYRDMYTGVTPEGIN